MTVTTTTTTDNNGAYQTPKPDCEDVGDDETPTITAAVSRGIVAPPPI